MSQDEIMAMTLETTSEKKMSSGNDFTPTVATSSVNGMPTPHEMMVYQTIADQAAHSKMYKGIGDTSGIMMIMLAARELSIPPLQALNGGLNIIQGKVEISARMMNALIRRGGHGISILESSDSICKLKGRRADTGDTAEVSYSIAEAQKAGLVKQGGGWTKNPKDMCFARALSRLARQLFSDVIGIGYVEGEIKGALQQSEPEMQVVENESVEEDLVPKYLAIFNKEDQEKAMEYLEIVRMHFDWTLEKTLKEMIKDELQTQVKFDRWKSKQKA